jgi:hypothetical protein
MSKSKDLKKAVISQFLKQEAEEAKLGVMDSKVLREVEWRDGVGNLNSIRLRAMAMGLPTYCLELFPGGELWLEDDGIAKLARFFVWLDKHAALERTKLYKQNSKIRAQARRKDWKSE